MFNIGDKVKLNEELCPEAKRAEKKFQFGSLNYLAVMLTWELEVVRSFRDDYHGDMVEVKVTNIDTARSNFCIKVSDAVLSFDASTKLSYTVVGKFNKFQTEIDKLKALENTLLLDRVNKKKQGMTIGDDKLKQNWKEIKNARNQIIKLEHSPDKAFKVRHNPTNKEYTMECKEEDIPRKLLSMIRMQRKVAKNIKVDVKQLAAGLTLEKIGGVMAKKGRIAEINETYALAVIREHKKPTTNDTYVGIEIEMLSKVDIESMNKAFVKARLHRYVNVGTDESIRGDATDQRYYPMELRICLPEKLVEEKLREICKVLRASDCYANRTCGMHVHLDMRNRDPELCYRNFFKIQNIMLASQPEVRRNNRYCMPNTEPKKKLKDFSAGSTNDRNAYNVKRRVVINTDSYHKNDMRTIEIRVHEGATKFKDIHNWVKFLVETATLTEDLSKEMKTIKDLKDEKYLSASILKHLEERIEEYSA